VPTGESLVVVRTTEARTPNAVDILARIAHPSVFTIRSAGRFDSLSEPDERQREPAATETLSDCGAELAASHQLDPSTRSQSLLPALRDCEGAIERARAHLGEAARLEYGITHAAEWLLDNAYLIRSHIAEIRHNLPDNHNRFLPVLVEANAPSRSVRLRIYRIAADLIHRTAYRISPESIVSFLSGYQRHAPLTIAELWVLPLMLRLVLLQRLRRLAEFASLRQHQKERADFWANRLVHAAHRGPQQFEAILGEFDLDGGELTPHFITRLGEQLQKEEPALAPIQKWIEAKTGFNLADINLREHADEANDLLYISTAIGSLRQLSEMQYPVIVESVSRMEEILRGDPSGVHPQSDFATRDRCRQIVEETARQSKMPEWAVANLAVELAQDAPRNSREGCVAFYLLDAGLPELEKRVKRRLSWRQRRLRFIFRHPTLVYLGGIGTVTTAIAGAFLVAAYAMGVGSPLLFLLLGVLALVPASDLALCLVQMWLAWSVARRALP
jgi:hypothetical protein